MRGSCVFGLRTASLERMRASTAPAACTLPGTVPVGLEHFMNGRRGKEKRRSTSADFFIGRFCLCFIFCPMYPSAPPPPSDVNLTQHPGRYLRIAGVTRMCNIIPPFCRLCVSRLSG
ncbi:unnamed protein product [Ectocarpus sp. 13 AM-2016]